MRDFVRISTRQNDVLVFVRKRGTQSTLLHDDIHVLLTRRLLCSNKRIVSQGCVKYRTQTMRSTYIELQLPTTLELSTVSILLWITHCFSTICTRIQPICPRCLRINARVIFCNPVNIRRFTCRGVHQCPPVRDRIVCANCRLVQADYDRLRTKAAEIQILLDELDRAGVSAKPEGAREMNRLRREYTDTVDRLHALI